MWNEVVLNLRRKAEIYGVDLFFDAAVGGQNRVAFKSAEDLGGLKDSVLLDTCRKLELISDVVFRKLDHILLMRNEVAASHPNVESIGGFELLGWMQTCVRDVIKEKPSQSAIQVRQLVESIRTTDTVLDDVSVARVTEELKHLATAHSNNLLLTAFGMFVDPGLDQVRKKNLLLIGPAIWQGAEDRVRLRVGAMVDRFRTNLQTSKVQDAVTFLKGVGGLRYESIPARVSALQSLADRLRAAHAGMDNFYNEPPIIEDILSYIQSSRDIPRDVLPSLVRAVVPCRIGRGVSYCNGVSPSGQPQYDRFLGLLDDEGISECIKALLEPSVSSKLRNPICQVHLRNLLSILLPLVISDRLRECLQFLLANAASMDSMLGRRDFLDLAGPLNLVPRRPA